ncbi:MAG: TIGR02147 family protein [Chitinispirillaceae bacterium]|nr:TIGR02147 family protein [Chitinispirillaceae bacterium]
MKQLFEYFDYQEFLRDFYEEKKRDNQYISYRYLGNHMHIDPGFLLKVLQGRHHLAERSIGPVCAFFKFSERESRYFEILVRYNKAKTASDIKLYFEKLMTLRESRARPVEESQYAFYQKWYHSAIHALLSIYEFNGEYKKLASLLSPPITAKQAQESIRLLTRIGMIKRGEDGIYRPAEAFVTSGEKWRSAAIRNFQKLTIDLSARALDLHAKELRDISTVTVALAAKDLPEIRERIRQFRQSILTLDNDNEADTVYQVNIQVIPVTHTLGGGQ